MSNDTYCYLKPEARVSKSKLGGKWLVDADSPLQKQGYGHYEDALAEACARTARELRRQADAYQRRAVMTALDPDLLTTS